MLKRGIVVLGIDISVMLEQQLDHPQVALVVGGFMEKRPSILLGRIPHVSPAFQEALELAIAVRFQGVPQVLWIRHGCKPR